MILNQDYLGNKICATFTQLRLLIPFVLVFPRVYRKKKPYRFYILLAYKTEEYRGHTQRIHCNENMG